ncbi:MAG: hypothetical protein HOP28_13785 [Gemmatimonadales bacterium]|nr:hypothetical protein [Gemmatimonadales bacterium]
MTERLMALQQRLAAGAVRGRYTLFVNLGWVLAIGGAALFVVALTGGEGSRAWQAFHVNWIFFTGITGGSLALAAVHKVVNAKWSGVIIRFSEATVFFAVVSVIACILIFTLGYEAIYGHMHEQLHSLPHGKALWLSHEFMAGRLILGLIVLFGVGWKLVRADLTPDMAAVKGAVDEARRPLYEQWTAGYDGSPAGALANEAKIRRLAPLYVVLYALVFTLIAFDGIMALQPHWFSNLLGGWYFMGSFLGAHTLLALLALYGRKQLGIADLVSPKQRHDLGKLCFGFTVFWAYLMWSQFLVIWYGNLPEETGFVFARLWGPWQPVGRWVFLGMFLIPFWGLIFVAAKKSPLFLGIFATISLVSLWVERYLLVTPSVTHEAGPVFGLPEAGPLLLFLGCFLLAYGIFARTFPMLSPRLATITLLDERKHGHGEEFFHDEKPADFAMPAELDRRDHSR